MDCAVSLFKFHNESTNVWSHLLGALGCVTMIVLILVYYPSVYSESQLITRDLRSDSNLPNYLVAQTDEWKQNIDVSLQKEEVSIEER